jgi:hypothetical protein
MTQSKRISLKALLLGFLTDIGGSLVCGIGLGIVWGIALAARGVPANQIAAHFQGMAFFVTSLVLGFGFTVLGGYVAGRVAKRSEMLHGGIVGGIGIVFGILFAAALPLWCTIVSSAGVVPFGMVGGFLARQRPGMKLNILKWTRLLVIVALVSVLQASCRTVDRSSTAKVSGILAPPAIFTYTGDEVRAAREFCRRQGDLDGFVLCQQELSRLTKQETIPETPAPDLIKVLEKFRASQDSAAEK